MLKKLGGSGQICTKIKRRRRPGRREITEEAPAAKENIHIANGGLIDAANTKEWHQWSVSELLGPIIDELLKEYGHLMCHPFACQVGNKNKFLSHEAHETGRAAMADGPSGYVLRHEGGRFTSKFWVAQRIAVVEIGSSGGDVWWRRAEKAAVKYLWDRGLDTCNKKHGGGGGNDTTGLFGLNFLTTLISTKFSKGGLSTKQKKRCGIIVCINTCRTGINK